MRFAVRPGDPRQWARALREAAMRGRNLAGGSSLGINNAQQMYLAWVSATRTQLRNAFNDPGAWEPLHSPTFWHFADLLGPGEMPRWAELLGEELTAQCQRLERLADDLDRVAAHRDAAQGPMVVLDTHVLLHFQPPDQVKWGEVTGRSGPVRLVVPLRVVEELDEKKYLAREDVAARARSVVSMLRRWDAEGDGKPVVLADGVTLEIPDEPGPRRRTLDADEEVLAECEQLAAIGADVVLVTDDAGAAIRGRRRGLHVVAMPDKYLRRRQ